MAAKPENTFIAKVHRLLPHDLHKEKMNNPYSSGTADVWYSGNGGDLWVEYKYLPRTPQRADVNPKKLLSELQSRWLSGRHHEGRNIAVIIGCPDGGVVLRDCAWEKVISATTFVSLVLSRSDLAEWIRKQTMR